MQAFKIDTTMRFLLWSVAVIALFIADLCLGSVSLMPGEVVSALLGRSDASTAKIVADLRLTRAVTALTAGAALSVSGLQMQTLFRNPLAGPYVLGISSGASLGVALLMLWLPTGALAGVWGEWSVAAGAWIGAAAVLVIVGAVTRRVRDIMVVLVVGMMLSSGISAVVQIMQYLGSEASLKNFVVWTMGALGDVTRSQLWIFVPAVVAGLILAIASVKSLNLLLFGEEYAVSMGLRIKQSRTMLFISTTLLAGSVTAFCGPIGFLGLAMPHVARGAFSTSDSRVLVPASMISGSAALLLCDIFSKQFALPVNAMTALLGIPIIIWIVLKKR